jgi:hypothetical protein
MARFIAAQFFPSFRGAARAANPESFSIPRDSGSTLRAVRNDIATKQMAGLDPAIHFEVTDAKKDGCAGQARA